MNLNKAYVYILSNKNRTVLYIGVTNDLERRIVEHRQGNGSLFTKKYNVNELVYYEIHSNIEQAIAREKQLKEWKRDWKLELIKTLNSEMTDLAKDWALPDFVND
ncbi:MAG: Excinuclease subunit domain protein [Bacteroidetes bacterium]|nr:Excinuclease subunit domain protein [Bacteroidota bacterium]